ncbi:MAG: Unknown protein [uncultured Sulfurovum sp.]|uniref:Endonuclease GajA/Old nuclease/RecF-like AAA domain-containing protein n=1 Tax=uncultured Sulfurovum sp. TaxID=269237 RepID=A0A6S6SY23_9BACT|nr:MAG: Unknown protein [uncultured Sulfurovum sp.]
MERLIVKNFGPLKDVDIELNKINLFIGENGSGKSVLAKLITIFTSLNEFSEEKILKKINEYKINFIREESIIEFFSNDTLLLKLQKGNIELDLDLEEAVLENEKVKEPWEELSKKIEKIETESKNLNLLFELFKGMQSYQESLLSQYIPAERNLISLFNKSLTTLLLAEVPLPKFLLAFSSEFEKAGNDLKELKFLNVKYVNGDGLDRHKIYFNDEDYLSLEHSSSGIQSSLPLYLTVTYLTQKHRNIIIEEPEQNLFPRAQKETIQYIIEQVSDRNNLFMMTHSPYVLSTLNILMMAYRAGSLGEEAKKEVSELFTVKQWINPDNFSAYYLENGTARNIKGRTGLISDNEIDEISDDIQFEFEELLTIYREHKNDK